MSQHIAWYILMRILLHIYMQRMDSNPNRVLYLIMRVGSMSSPTGLSSVPCQSIRQWYPRWAIGSFSLSIPTQMDKLKCCNTTCKYVVPQLCVVPSTGYQGCLVGSGSRGNR